MKRRILFVISNIDYSLGFEWLARFLDKEKFELCFVFLNSTEPSLVGIMRGRGIQTHYLSYSGKSDIPKSAVKFFNIIRKFKPDTVHAHLFDACLIALPIARLLGVKQRIYTRHHSTFHLVYHPSMVKYDRFINSQCTNIVAISENVAEVLRDQENVVASNIKLIHHGFDLQAFHTPDQNSISRLKSILNIDSHEPVIGVISRYTEWKGVQYIIPAFEKLLVEYPKAKLVLANAKGEYTGVIKALLAKLPADSYSEVGFEKDIVSLYSLFNIFVHVPIDAESEAFGQTYVESLACSVPSIFTLSGIAREFIIDRKNALVVPFKNSSAIYSAMKMILENPDLSKTIQNSGRNEVKILFPVDKMIKSLEQLYAN